MTIEDDPMPDITQLPVEDDGEDADEDIGTYFGPLASARRRATSYESGERSSARTGDDRPDITVAGGALPEIVDAAETAMLERGPPIFQRGALLVRVVRTVGGDSAGVRREAGTPVIRQVDATWLREQLTRVARFRKWDARMEDYKSVDCPKEVAETLLARCGTWRARPLRTIVQAPTPRPDGSVIEREGYDSETALLFDANGMQFPPVPERPSKADALTALNRLLRPLEEFPFDNRQDEAVAVSAVLTALARPSLRTAPMHVFSAPAAGSGKSMLADYAAIVSTGRPASVVTHGRTDEEAEKRIGAVLLQGDQVVNLDNVERPLCGELLCQLLTQETIKVRKLGVSEMIDAPSVATFLATGNNLTVTGDLVRRVVMCALDPKDERPEHRRFSRDFYAHVRENRGQLVADALTVLKAFKVAGCPDQNLQPLGGFADWSAWIRNALVWLDMADPCLTTERLRETDPGVGNLRAVVTAWLETFGEQPVTARQAIDRATFTVNGQLTNESLHEALTAVAGDKGGINARRLGNWLRKHDGRVIDGFRIERDGDDGHGIVCWKTTRVRSETDSHPGFRVSPGFPQYPVGNCQERDSDGDGDSDAGGGETNPERPGNPDAGEGQLR